MKPFKPPAPIATQSLIGLCIAVEAAVWLGGSAFGQAVDWNFGLIPGRISAALAGRAEPLSAAATLLTHMFLHSGWVHLGLNILFLAWVGKFVEWVVGRGRLVLLFLAGGIVGGLVQVIADPAGNVPVVGASGAIAAVFGAYAMLFAAQRVNDRRFLGITLSGEFLTALWYAAAWIGLQLLTGLVFNTGGASIAIWTHIGGFLAGMVLARPLAGKPPLV